MIKSVWSSLAKLWLIIIISCKKKTSEPLHIRALAFSRSYSQAV